MIAIETYKEQKLRENARRCSLENDVATKKAKTAFNHKPYQSMSVSEYLAKKYKIGGDTNE